MRRKLVLGLVATTLFVGGMFLGMKVNEPKNVTVLEVTKDGDKITTDFTDGSWSVVNEEKGVYVFQPVDMGDWDYECDNMEQLKNVISTYLQVKNTGYF